MNLALLQSLDFDFELSVGEDTEPVQRDAAICVQLVYLFDPLRKSVRLGGLPYPQVFCHLSHSQGCQRIYSVARC